MRRLLLTPLFVLLLGFGASAQEGKTAPTEQATMTLTGAVYDENGALIVASGAAVVARGEDGKVFKASPDHDGIYVLKLPLGVYQLEAAAPYFCPSKADYFRVVNATHGKMSLDFVLEVAGSHATCVRGPAAGGEEKKP